jgi:hypothetical protein
MGLAGAWGLMERGMSERECCRRAEELLERKAQMVLSDRVKASQASG